MWLALAQEGFTGPGTNLSFVLLSCLPLVLGLAAVVYALVLLTRIHQALQHIRDRIDAATRELGPP